MCAAWVSPQVAVLPSLGLSAMTDQSAWMAMGAHKIAAAQMTLGAYKTMTACKMAAAQTTLGVYNSTAACKTLAVSALS